MVLDLDLLRKSAYAFALGILLFSGSLYIFVFGKLIGLNKIDLIHFITPIGGVCFIIGWIFLIIAAMKMKQNIF